MKLQRHSSHRSLVARLAILAALFVFMATSCGKDTGAWLDDMADDDPYVRLMAATALGTEEVGRTQTEKVVRALIHAKTSDRAEEVREQAAASLKAIAPFAHEALIGYLCRHPEDEVAARHLLDMSDWAYAGIVQQLADPSCKSGLLLAKVLGNARDPVPAVPLLVEKLEVGDESTQRLAAHALMLIGPRARQAVPALTKLAESGDVDVAAEARAALARICARDM
jgi:HEAT repeat protein